MKVLDNGFVEILDVMGDDLAIVNAARKSFNRESKKWTKKDATLLKYMWDEGHTSPFEMVEFKFAVKAPLFVVRQWHRHRTWSYNEVSRRYTSDGLDFYYPKVWRKQSKDNKQSSHGSAIADLNEYCDMKLNNICANAYSQYTQLIFLGICREQARMVLPQNMMVEMVAKVDLSNLIKFLKLRNHPHAQWEIQEYARAIEVLIDEYVPKTMKLYRGEK